MTTSARHPASCSGASAVGKPASFGELASRHPSGPEQRFGARLGSAVARTSLARGPNDTRRTTPALVGTRSTPPRRSPLRRRSTGTPGRLPASVGETLGRSLKSPEATAGFGQQVPREPCPSVPPNGGTARRRCRTRGFGPARHLFATTRARTPTLESDRSSRRLRPNRVRDTAKGPSHVGPHPRVRSGRQASTDLRVRRVWEATLGWPTLRVVARTGTVRRRGCPAHDA